MINPQMGFGADVMSRVAAALIPENRDRMRKLTIAALNRATRSLPREHGRAPRVEELCVAANPAMTGTLLHFDLAALRSEVQLLQCTIATRLPSGVVTMSIIS